MGRFFMSLFGCLTVPFHRLILVHSSANEIEAVIIKFAKFILRFGIALFRRPVKPLRRQPQVVCRLPERFVCHDFTSIIEFAQLILRHGITLIRCIAVPSQIQFCTSITLFNHLAPPLLSLFQVLHHALTFAIAKTQLSLRFSIALFCRLVIPLNRFGFIRHHSITFVIAIAKRALRRNISIFCRFTVPLRRFRQVFNHTPTTTIT